MKKIFLALTVVLAPITLCPLALSLTEAADMWWCPKCGLCYPASQKVCLNKDCPLFRKHK
jgi:hypothetical protein